MKKRYLPLLAFGFAAAVVFATFFYQPALKAEQRYNWLSIDKNELEHIKASAASKGIGLDIEEEELAPGGIAILRVNEPDFEKISSLMHEEFHKCSGFIAHQSREEAIAEVADSLSADPGAKFVDYVIDNQANVAPMLSEAAELPLRQAIIDLSAFPNRRYNLQGGLDGANWIRNKWTALANGRSDTTVEFFTHPTATSPQPSVVMTITGTTLPSEIVVIGGHQDSINSSGSAQPAPGADDDASGIATITEIIRVLMAKNFRPNRTVKFMAYAAEEVGLRGSAAIAADHRNRNANVVGVMQLDMTNFKGTPTADIVLIQDFTNAAQNTFIQSLVAAYQPSLVTATSSCGYACSDHASWHNRSYPASMPFESTLANSNNAIHTANDTIGRSGTNAVHALKFAKLGLSYIGELAKGSIVSLNRPVADFDGDGKTDISVFRPAGGAWYLNRSTAGFAGVNFGISDDIPVSQDFDGDGKADIAVFRPQSGSWFFLRSSDGSFTGLNFGSIGDIPVPGDFDGDGKADVAVFRPSSGVWYRINSLDSSVSVFTFGQPGDSPVRGDFDGDRKADYAVFRAGAWYYTKSTTNHAGFEGYNFGSAGDKPLSGDFDGDGKNDLAVWRPSDGVWYQNLSSGGLRFTQFGAAGDIPSPGDFDGDGKSDVAVFRAGVWYTLNSQSGALSVSSFGISGDRPVPASYSPQN